MNWQKYDLVFRLLAPLHVGWRKVSNLQQTRGYVTGKMFWAALTARLTREANQGANGQMYQELGKLVKDNFRFTYLYPALQTDSDYTLYYPWERDFEYLFLDSYTSTALDYTYQSAEDGMLHETEFISPCTCDGQSVYLKGVLYTQNNLDEKLKNWQDALSKLQFGGERGYGWGSVRPVVCKQDETYNGDEPKIQVAENSHITAHLKTEKATNVIGSIEPLIGWERNNGNGHPWKLSDKAVICYAPGSITSIKKTFSIVDYGLWE
ncbi:MAG: hypothetical protein GFH27_549409n2 [Chloroflexi bacterium AL-W]|nr:hypothetical protein [Chloroflexi bacterium AL-N1]NOK71337.1 hypothetical protein [Chloroflexi bacterium AL-N10]NOK78740.1 hypothetical protein [Chloroflexi bacterium AL-N5]NOK86110.1 hypothetical protein [Chloroflexi bacterium AL-W]NOK93063.1 hypothetical protein [Chloroflexi bacterium AL-N15]